MKEFWTKVNPKVKAVALIGLLGTVVSVLNAAADVYPDGWQSTAILAAIMIVGGWAKSAAETGIK